MPAATGSSESWQSDGRFCYAVARMVSEEPETDRDRGAFRRHGRPPPSSSRPRPSAPSMDWARRSSVAAEAARSSGRVDAARWELGSGRGGDAKKGDAAIAARRRSGAMVELVLWRLRWGAELRAARSKGDAFQTAAGDLAPSAAVLVEVVAAEAIGDGGRTVVAVACRQGISSTPLRARSPDVVLQPWI